MKDLEQDAVHTMKIGNNDVFVVAGGEEVVVGRSETDGADFMGVWSISGDVACASNVE